MFWQFENWSASQIDKLLEKEDASLTELLDEDDVIQECKSQNQRLLQFITQHKVLEQMIELMITEPPADKDEATRFKHSNIACELLITDLDLINDALIDEKLLDKLYHFIESETELNPLLASFFSKTMSLLCTKRTVPVLKFLQSKEQFVAHVLLHIETSAIVDFMLKLVTVPDADFRQEVVKWLSEKGLICQLVSMFSSSIRPEKQVNAAQFLCDIVKVTREQQTLLQEKALPNPLLEEIESSLTVSRIVDLMFESRTEVSIVQGIHVLQSLIEYKRHNANLNQPTSTAVPTPTVSGPEFEGVPQMLAQPMFGKTDSPDQVSALDASRLAKCVCQVHEAVTTRLPLFYSVLADPPSKPPVNTTVGVIEKPLGAARLEVAHFIRALLSSNSPAINKSLVDSRTVIILVNLFFEYPWNSFLHTQVEQSIKLIFENTKTSSPVTSPDVETVETRDAAISLAQQLLLDAELLQRLVDQWISYNNSSAENVDKPRPGYMGHLIKIANHIVEGSSQEPVLKIIAELPDEVRIKWDEFLKTNLVEVNTRLKTPLVAEAPTGGYGEAHQQESALHQVFLEYQMQQMTRNLCTQIGFNTAEFSELDKTSIQSRADQLSKINFNLEEQMDKIREGGLFDGDDLLKGEKDSSDEEDELWDEKSGSKKVEDMEVDVQDPWSSTLGPENAIQSWKVEEEKSTLLDKDQKVDDWADFETSFQAEPSSASDRREEDVASSSVTKTEETSAVPASEHPDVPIASDIKMNVSSESHSLEISYETAVKSEEDEEKS